MGMGLSIGAALSLFAPRKTTADTLAAHSAAIAAIQNGGTRYPKVDTFADLPAAAGHEDEIYVVRTATGTAFLLNRHERGLYRSDATKWQYLGSDTDATSIKVGTATITAAPVEFAAGDGADMAADTETAKVTVSVKTPVPAPVEADSGKAVVVKSDGTGVELRLLETEDVNGLDAALAGLAPWTLADSDGTYYGFTKGAEWQIKRVTIADGSVTRAYATSASNTGIDYADAWAARTELEYV